VSGAAPAAPLLLIGDVHGCADELAALIDQARPCQPVLVGDLYTKGPDAPGVWRIVQAEGARAVLGNHDQWLLEHPSEALALGLPLAALHALAALPLTLELGGITVVHAGLHPVERVAGTGRRLATTVRRWPDDRDRAAPFWWELLGPGPLVVYGHDAARGLQDHRPRSLGLDTGCVYGGQLTGYRVQPDDPLGGSLLSAPAARAYRPVERGQPGLGWRG
jgi:diadenosine tetraphosphatase ApaH/serine/threonine PP2A family protein phosphatase